MAPVKCKWERKADFKAYLNGAHCLALPEIALPSLRFTGNFTLILNSL